MIDALRATQAALRELLDQVPLEVKPAVFEALRGIHRALVALDAVRPEDDGCV